MLPQRRVATPDQRRVLQRDTIYGQEAKPLPYMLVQMNLLLHGLEAPQIAYGNTLDHRVNEIGHSERVDVILTNPPFGGEEVVGIKANFPPNMQTAETALLFLQYIMRKLRVAGAPVPGGKPAARGGRAAVVVPNGTLFGDGISAVIKEEMLKDFRLHTTGRPSLREKGQFPHMQGNAPITPHAALGRALRRLRLAAELTQEQLGLDAEVQRNFISLIETGQSQPTITTIFKLSQALGLKASDLVAEAEQEMRTKPKSRRSS